MCVRRLSPLRIAAAVVCAAIAVPGRAAAPEATPTPRPRHLADLGRSITLDRSALDQDDGRLHIDNRSLDRFAERGRITRCEAPAAPPPPAPSPAADDSARRERWRNTVDAQRRRIATAEAAVETARARVDALVSEAMAGGRGAARAWARVEEARTRRRLAEQRLEAERAGLTRIIRDARQDGAQPGWFR